jgi:ribosomal protein S12 methylthiotransferase accessory factor YcaO
VRRNAKERAKLEYLEKCFAESPRLTEVPVETDEFELVTNENI